MRPQQRSFVIEYKSSRRQTLKQERSIWGDTNFKALVKEAEADAPQLFEPQAVATADSNATHELQHEAVAIGPAENIEPEGAPLVPIKLIDSGYVECQPERLASVEPMTRIAEVSEDPVRKRRRRSNVIANARTRDVNGSAGSQQHVELEPISDDALRLLEAENEQLKASLVARLIDENAWMREMLERVTTV